MIPASPRHTPQRLDSVDRPRNRKTSPRGARERRGAKPSPLAITRAQARLSRVKDSFASAPKLSEWSAGGLGITCLRCPLARAAPTNNMRIRVYCRVLAIPSLRVICPWRFTMLWQRCAVCRVQIPCISEARFNFLCDYQFSN